MKRVAAVVRALVLLVSTAVAASGCKGDVRGEPEVELTPSPLTTSQKQQLSDLQAAAVAAESAFTALTASALALAAAPSSAAITDVKSRASAAASKAASVSTKTATVASSIGSTAAATLTAVSGATKKAADVALAEANALATTAPPADAVAGAGKFESLGGVSQAGSHNVASEAERLRLEEASFTSVAARTGSFAESAKGAAHAAAAEAERIEENMARLGQVKTTMEALEGVSNALTGAVDAQVKRLTALSNLSTAEKAILNNLMTAEKLAATAAKARAATIKTGAADAAASAVRDFSSLQEAKRGASEAVEAKSRRHAATMVNVQTEATAVKGTAEGAAHAAGAAAERRGELGNERALTTAMKDTLAALAELQEKTAAAMASAKDPLVARPELSPAEKQRYQDLTASAQAAASTAKAESSRAGTATGGQARAALRDAEAMGHVTGATAEAIVARATQQAAAAASAQAEAQGLAGASAAAAHGGEAARKRLEEAQRELASTQQRDALKQLGDAQARIVAAVAAIKDELVQRPEVGPLDKQQYQDLVQAAQDAASSVKAETARAGSSVGGQARDALDNAEALAHASGALGEAVAAKAERHASVGDLAAEAAAVEHTAGAAGHAAEATRGRLDRAEVEAATGQQRAAIEQLGDIQDKVLQAMAAAKDALVARADVGDVDRQHYENVTASAQAAAATSRAEAAFAGDSTGADSRRAIRNALSTADAAGAAAEAVGTKAAQQGAAEGMKAEAEALRGQARAAAHAAEAMQKRIEQAAAEPVGIGQQGIYDAIGAVQSTIQAAVESAADALSQRPEVAPIDRQQLGDITAAVHDMMETAQAEVQRAESSAGAQAHDARRNAGVAASTAGAAGKALEAKADQQARHAETAVEARAVEGMASAGKDVADATRKRLDEATNEMGSLERAGTLASMAGVQADVMAALNRATGQLVQRPDVAVADRAHYTDLGASAASVAAAVAAEMARAHQITGAASAAAVRNAGAMAEAVAGAAEAMAAKAAQQQKAAEARAEAQALQGVAAASAGIAAAERDRLARAQEELATVQQRDALKAVADMQARVMATVVRARDQLVARAEVSTADRTHYQNLGAAAQAAANTTGAEIARAATAVGEQQRQAQRNAEALSHAQAGVAQAIGAKAEQQAAFAEAAAEARALEGTAQAAGETGRAAQKRLDEAQREASTAEQKEALRQVADMQDKVTAAVMTARDQLVMRAEVSTADRTHYADLGSSVQSAAGTSKAEVARAATVAGVQQQAALRNAQAMGGVASAVGDALAAKAEQQQKFIDAQAEATALGGLGTALGESADALKARLEQAQKELASAQQHDALKKAADAQVRVGAAMNTARDQLVARPEVSAADKQHYQALGGAAAAAGNASKSEVTRATTSTGAAARDARDNAAGLAEAGGAAGEAAGAMGRRQADFADVDAAARAAEGTAAASARAGEASRERLDDARKQSVTAQMKDALQKMTDLQNKVVGAMGKATSDLAGHPQVAAADKQQYQDLSAAAGAAAATGVGETTRAGTSSGAQAQEALRNAQAELDAAGAAGQAIEAKAGQQAGFPDARRDAEAMQKAAEAAAHAGEAAGRRFEQGQAEVGSSQQRQAMQHLIDIQLRTIEAMLAAKDDLAARPEVSAADRQAYDGLGAASVEAIQQAFVEASAIDEGLPRATGLSRMEALGDANAATGRALEAQGKRMENQLRDLQAELAAAKEMGRASAHAAQSASTQAQLESLQEEVQAGTGVVVVLTDIAKAHADAVHTVADGIGGGGSGGTVRDPVLDKTAEAGAAAARAAHDRAQEVSSAADPRGAMSGSAAMAGATAAMGLAGAERAAGLNQPPGTPTTLEDRLNQIQAAVNAVEAANAAASNILAARADTSADVIGVTRALSSASQETASRARSEVSATAAAHGQASVGALGELAQAAERTAAELAALAAGTNLAEMEKRAAVAEASGYAAAAEAARLGARPASAAASAASVEAAIAATHAAVVAVAAEAQRLRQGGAMGVAGELTALGEAAKAAGNVAKAEGTRLSMTSSDPAVAKELADLQKAQQAANDVAVQAAAVAAGGGDMAAKVAALVGGTRKAQSAARDASTQAGTVTGSVGGGQSAQENLLGHLQAAGADALSTKTEARAAAADLASPENKPRLQSASSATQAAHDGAAAELARLLAGLAADAGVAQRIADLVNASNDAAGTVAGNVAAFVQGTGDAGQLLSGIVTFSGESQIAISLGDAEQLALVTESPLFGAGRNITVTLSFSSNWDTGYCAVFNVQNLEPLPTTSWLIEADVGPDGVVTPWNVTVSPLTGRVIMTPVDTATIIQPGQAVSVGFCVNRAAPNGTLAKIVRTAATF